MDDKRDIDVDIMFTLIAGSDDDDCDFNTPPPQLPFQYAFISEGVELVYNTKNVGKKAVEKQQKLLEEQVLLEIQEIERRLDFEDLTFEDDRHTKEDMRTRVKWYDGEPRMRASSSSSSGILRSHAQSNSLSRSRSRSGSRSGSMSQCLELEVERQNELLKRREFLKKMLQRNVPRGISYDTYVNAIEMNKEGALALDLPEPGEAIEEVSRDEDEDEGEYNSDDLQLCVIDANESECSQSRLTLSANDTGTMSYITMGSSKDEEIIDLETARRSKEAVSKSNFINDRHSIEVSISSSVAMEKETRLEDSAACAHFEEGEVSDQGISLCGANQDATNIIKRAETDEDQCSSLLYCTPNASDLTASMDEVHTGYYDTKAEHSISFSTKAASIGIIPNVSIESSKDENDTQESKYARCPPTAHGGNAPGFTPNSDSRPAPENATLDKCLALQTDSSECLHLPKSSFEHPIGTNDILSVCLFSLLTNTGYPSSLREYQNNQLFIDTTKEIRTGGEVDEHSNNESANDNRVESDLVTCIPPVATASPMPTTTSIPIQRTVLSNKSPESGVNMVREALYVTFLAFIFLVGYLFHCNTQLYNLEIQRNQINMLMHVLETNQAAEDKKRDPWITTSTRTRNTNDDFACTRIRKGSQQYDPGDFKQASNGALELLDNVVDEPRCRIKKSDTDTSRLSDFGLIDIGGISSDKKPPPKLEIPMQDFFLVQSALEV